MVAVLVIVAVGVSVGKSIHVPCAPNETEESVDVE